MPEVEEGDKNSGDNKALTNQPRLSMDKKGNLLVEKGNLAREKLINGARSVAKVGEYPIHFITSKEVIKYVERPVSTIKTWMKFVAVMLAASLLMWQLVEKIRSYVENPVIVTPQYSYVDSLPFPGVILCNSQPFRSSYVTETGMAPILSYQNTVKSGTKPGGSPPDFHLRNALNMKDYFYNASQPVQEFIMGCYWLGRSTNCSASDFKLVVTDYGPCFQLNIPQNKWPYVTNAGSVSALQVVINIDTMNSFAMMGMKTVGAFIALFPFENPTPVVSYIGFTAPPGFETSIAITSESVERLQIGEKGSCDPNKFLVFFQNYTTTGCYMETKFMKMIKACDCLPYNLPTYRNPKTTAETLDFLKKPICNVEKQLVCVEVLKQLDNMALNSNDGSSVTCPEACKIQTYTSELTYSMIAGDQLYDNLPTEKLDILNKVFNISNKGTDVSKSAKNALLRDNFVVINIYFKELVNVNIRQHLMYYGWAFAADIAGTIGIILGFLITTLGEVIDNCQMLYRKVRGVVDPGKEKVVKVVEKEERIEPREAENGTELRERRV